MITSPYVGLNATKDQRQQQIQNLKKHVQEVMNRGRIIEDKKHTKSIKESFKIAPISNAFFLEIKNQREEALKNMEHLRQSVKLQKRANPLEKIVNKLIGNERDYMLVPLETPLTPKTSSLKEDNKNDPQNSAKS